MAIDDRQIPFSLEAEEATLGAMLLDDVAPARVFEIVSEKDFYRDKNCWVAGTIRQLQLRDEAINTITVAHELERGGRLEVLGGSAYLTNLLASCPTPMHAEYYAHIVKRCSQQRELIAAANAIAEMGYNGIEPSEANAKALRMILELKQESTRDRMQRFGDFALDYYPEFTEWIEGGFKPQGVLTGFKDLDQILGGLKPGRLCIIAGRPGMGKSQMCLQIAQRCAERGDTPAFFSLEMGKHDLLHRLVFAEARVNEQKLRRGNDEEKETAANVLKDKFSELMALPMWFDDTASINTQTAQLEMVQLLAKENISIMFFDHISLAGDTTKSGNEVQRIGEIMRGLKRIAKVCNIPIVIASQMSREVSKSRTDHRPRLEDLRSSGDLEQDADVVLGLYRHEYYFPKGVKGYKQDCENFLEILVLKQRMGAGNPRGGLSTGIFYDVKTGQMGDWYGEFPSKEVD